MKRVDDKILDEAALSYQVLKHRTDKTQRAIGQMKENAGRLGHEIDQLDDELDALLRQTDMLLKGDTAFTDQDIKNADELLKQIEYEYTPGSGYEYKKLDTLNFSGSWGNFMFEIRDYAEKNEIDLDADPFEGLLTQTERDRIAEKILADYKVNMDPEERKSAIESYLSYAMLIAAISTGRASEHADEINSLCEMASDLLCQYINIDSKYNHNDFLKKPENLNDWFIYFDKYYPDLFKGILTSTDATEKTLKSTCELESALHELGRRPGWEGMIFSIIYQFVRTEEEPVSDTRLYIINVSGSVEIIGRNKACKLIAGFVNWMDVLCSRGSEHTEESDDAAIRSLVLAMLDRCGFGESDQEGIVKTIQDFALDVYNNLSDDEKQIDGMDVELFLCDYMMQFLAALQKRAEGVPFLQASVMAGDDFVRRCQVAGYGMLSILKKGSTVVGKADFVSPLLRLVNSVDVEGWAEFTYQSLLRARTAYLGYYMDLEKMDEDLEDGWQEFLDKGVTVSRRQF